MVNVLESEYNNKPNWYEKYISSGEDYAVDLFPGGLVARQYRSKRNYRALRVTAAVGIEALRILLWPQPVVGTWPAVTALGQLMKTKPLEDVVNEPKD